MFCFFLYDILYGNFVGGFDLNIVSEMDQVILLVFDNMQCIFNCWVGMLVYLLDYGLLDMIVIFQGMLVLVYQLMSMLLVVLLKYELCLQWIVVVMFDQYVFGELCYVIDVELKDIGLVCYGMEFMFEGRVLICYFKCQQYFDVCFVF